MSVNEFNKFKKELKNSKTHGFMHLPEEHKKEIFSLHRRDKHKTIWYKGGDWVEMESKNTPTNPELVAYRCPTFPYHSLHDCVMTTKTPRIRAKQGYKVCFNQDLLINMISEFHLFHNEVELQYANTLSIMETVRGDPDMSFHLGNQENLLTPSEELKSTFLSLKIPTFYSKNDNDSFPLIYCGQKDDLIHQIKFNLDFSQLLTIFDVDGQEVDFSLEHLEIESNLEMMPIPELEGLCSFLKEEDSQLVNSFSSDNIGEDKELYTSSIYYYEDENPKNLGNKVIINFKSEDKQPVQSIFWGAQNNTLSQSSKSLKIHFNKGDEERSPIKFTEKLSTSSAILINNKSSYKTEFAYHGGRGTTGLNRWQNNVERKQDGRKFQPGIRCSNGSLVVRLNDKHSEDKFTVFAILNYVKRFRFTSYPKSYQERKDLRSTLIPDDDE